MSARILPGLAVGVLHVGGLHAASGLVARGNSARVDTADEPKKGMAISTLWGWNMGEDSSAHMLQAPPLLLNRLAVTASWVCRCDANLKGAAV